jgi:Fe-S-cluster-containing dehydrogenase component/formate-dependent nitrite reductase membrane component NrfD
MRYGFAIDQRTCIGCHACTVACKTEHEIPVGQFRTWVKYVDSGSFPDTTRDFGVMRCNHCTDAPCGKICPTKALFVRPDGIVDFDNERCIGCKGCMQACPYDAIYIDKNTNTAAKCNFCAHRVDAGYEPACVVVCPTHSIWVGDLSDPTSGIATLIANNSVMVRSPEQRTGPNVFYLGAERAVLDPLAAPVDASYIYSTPDAQRAAISAHLPRDEQTQARTTLNTAHPRPWGWRVVTYLWTKGVAAGVMFLVAAAFLFDRHMGHDGTVVGPLIALGGLAATGVLLVADLKQPMRFYYLLTKPNPRSWLVLGSVALAAFGGLATLWLLVGAIGEHEDSGYHNVLNALSIPAMLAAVGAAGYTAFLFGQAEGRDLWQSRLLFPHLLAQAGMVGAGVLALLTPSREVRPEADEFIVRALVVATVLHIAIAIVEFYGAHDSKAAGAAAHLATSGPYALLFRGSLALALVAAGLAAFSWDGKHLGLAVAAGILVQVALLAYETVFVRAGQDVPLS